MKYLHILLFIFLSACDPGYSVAYKINFDNGMEETKINDIKNSVIKEGNLTKVEDLATQQEYQSKLNGYNVYFYKETGYINIIFYTTGTRKNNEMENAINILNAKLKSNNIKFLLEKELK